MTDPRKKTPADDNAAKQKKTARQSWSSRSLGKRWQHAFFYTLLRLGGLKPARFCLFFVVLFFCLHPGIAGRARPYLEHRFGSASFRHIFRLYWMFGCILLERAAVGLFGKYTARMRDNSLETLTGLLGEGKGIIILSAHVGAWQIALADLHLGVKVNIVQPRGLGDVDRHFFEHSTGGTPKVTEFAIIDPDSDFGGWLDILAALRRGEIVCLKGDRVPAREKQGFKLPFLGEPVAVPASPYMLASLSGAPLVALFSRRVGECQIEGFCAACFKIPPGLGRSESRLRPYAEKFVLALENYVMENPYQFFNFYNLWAR